MSKPLTIDRFIEAFRIDTGWKCEPGTRITNELTEFAKQRDGSTRDIIELLLIFKISKGIDPTIRNSEKIEQL